MENKEHRSRLLGPRYSPASPGRPCSRAPLPNFNVYVILLCSNYGSVCLEQNLRVCISNRLPRSMNPIFKQRSILGSYGAVTPFKKDVTYK